VRQGKWWPHGFQGPVARSAKGTGPESKEKGHTEPNWGAGGQEAIASARLDRAARWWSHGRLMSALQGTGGTSSRAHGNMPSWPRHTPLSGALGWGALAPSSARS
jgi:hypothetical protein